MFTPEMLASVKKVEATRQERLGMEPRRMTAEEKDALLKAYHPDYREDGFDTIKIGPNKGEKVPKELGHLLHSNSRLLHHPIDLTITTPTCSSSAAAAQVLPRLLRRTTQVRRS